MIRTREPTAVTSGEMLDELTRNLRDPLYSVPQLPEAAWQFGSLACDTAVVRIDDQMQLLDGDYRLPTLGAQFSPLDLLGTESLLHNISAG